MRKAIWMVALLGLIGTGCSDKDEGLTGVVRGHIDGLLKAGIEDLPSRILPGAERKKRLYPDEEVTPGFARGYLGKNAHGKALLALDQAAVPALAALLQDPMRRTLAVVFLGEIGGPEAAAALLEEWRRLRDHARASRAYIDHDGMHLVSTVYETPDDQLVQALTHSLSLSGLPVVTEVVTDTLAALSAAEALQRAGAAVKLEEARRLEDRPAKLIWWVEPVETAKEGLEILAMVGGQDAVPVLERALRSPIRTIRWNAIQVSLHMAYEAEPLLPALLEALSDPAFRERALSTLQGLYMTGEHLKRSDPKPTEAEWAELVGRWEKRIKAERIPRTRTKTTTVSHGG